MDVNLADYDARTALHLAATEGQLLAVSFLLGTARANSSPQDGPEQPGEPKMGVWCGVVCHIFWDSFGKRLRKSANRQLAFCGF